MTNRRDFLKMSAIAGGTVGLGLIPGVSALVDASNEVQRAVHPGPG